MASITTNSSICNSGIGRCFCKGGDGGSKKKGAGRVGERARSARRRAVPDASCKRRASVVRGEEAGLFREVAGVSIVAAACPRSAVDTSSSTVDSRVTTSLFNITT